MSKLHWAPILFVLIKFSWWNGKQRQRRRRPKLAASFLQRTRPINPQKNVLKKWKSSSGDMERGRLFRFKFSPLKFNYIRLDFTFQFFKILHKTTSNFHIFQKKTECDICLLKQTYSSIISNNILKNMFFWAKVILNLNFSALENIIWPELK